MEVTRIAAAAGYAAAKHHGVEAFRLQGFDATGSEAFWVGLSHYEAGGRAERDGSPTEKVYVVLDGEITVITDSGEAVLGALDSCYLAPGEARAVENRSGARASMLVVMEYPPAVAEAG
ncbi:MAG TPA: cupin domain-containing protein [Solirubrobacteraceae bacterium]|jgi:quercetin dioxygenase-like cupin family protein|nr:cupin domain-containing protein [Solirubrobacteraceae bacterium]